MSYVLNSYLLKKGPPLPCQPHTRSAVSQILEATTCRPRSKTMGFQICGGTLSGVVIELGAML